MKAFPLSKEEWYKFRDDRTIKIAKGFENFSLAVLVDPNVESSYSLQLMTKLTLNMCADGAGKSLFNCQKK